MAKEVFYQFGTLIVETVFEYDTPKYVHIKNKKIGVIYRLVQLAILAYVIGYGIVYQHQAQKFESVQSVVTTKLKGVDLVDDPSSFMTNCPTRPSDQNWVVFDHTDLVVPPQQPSAFFVTTNMWVTCNQTYGECPEDKTVSGAACTSSADCPVGVVLRAGNGITTGNCSNFDNPSEEGTCMIKAWCPVEDENDTLTQQGPKVDIRNFTVLMKNTVSFPTLEKNFRVRNIATDADKAFLNTCVHNDTTGLYCPIFSLGQIIDMANSTPEFYHEVTTYGAVVGLQVHWDCNLDFGKCSLKYEASRLDNPEVRISPGYNFRYSRYYTEGSQQYRDEIKAYGILFMVEVTGQGRKFDVVTLVLALGSTIALLAIATVVTDGFAMYIVKRAGYYRTKKYQQVDKEQLSDGDREPQTNVHVDPKINYGSTTAEGSLDEKQPLLMEVQPAAGSPP